MKKIIKNLAVIAIALFGFAVIGVNVVSVSYGNPYETIMEDPGEGGGGVAGICYTNYMGGVAAVTPCINYNPNYLPPYQCGTPIPFTWPSGQGRNCYW